MTVGSIDSRYGSRSDIRLWYQWLNTGCLRTACTLFSLISLAEVTSNTYTRQWMCCSPFSRDFHHSSGLISTNRQCTWVGFIPVHNTRTPLLWLLR